MKAVSRTRVMGGIRPGNKTKSTWVKDVYKDGAPWVISRLTKDIHKNGHPKGSRYIVGFRKGRGCNRVGIYLEVPVTG